MTVALAIAAIGAALYADVEHRLWPFRDVCWPALLEVRWLRTRSATTVVVDFTAFADLKPGSVLASWAQP